MGLPSTLSELPLAVRVTHRYTLSFLDMLVPDGVEESVEEARGEITGGLFGFYSESFTVLSHFYRLIQRDRSYLAVLHEVDNMFYGILLL